MSLVKLQFIRFSNGREQIVTGDGQPAQTYSFLFVIDFDYPVFTFQCFDIPSRSYAAV